MHQESVTENASCDALLAELPAELRDIVLRRSYRAAVSERLRYLLDPQTTATFDRVMRLNQVIVVYRRSVGGHCKAFTLRNGTKTGTVEQRLFSIYCGRKVVLNGWENATIAAMKIIGKSCCTFEIAMRDCYKRDLRYLPPRPYTVPELATTLLGLTS